MFYLEVIITISKLGYYNSAEDCNKNHRPTFAQHIPCIFCTSSKF